MHSDQLNQFINELDKLKTTTQLRNLRADLYWPIMSISTRDSELTRDKIGKAVKIAGGSLKIPSLKELKRGYQTVCNRLNRAYSTVVSRTSTELEMRGRVIRSTKMEIMRSAWIGNHNVDLFLPALCGVAYEEGVGRRPFRGLALEIDGRIHLLEAKERKDMSKMEFLTKMKIAVYSVATWDLNKSTVKAFIQALSTLPRSDSKSRASMRRRIYLETLFHHASWDEMEELFGFDYLALRQSAPSLGV